MVRFSLNQFMPTYEEGGGSKGKAAKPGAKAGGKKGGGSKKTAAKGGAKGGAKGKGGKKK